MAFGMPHWGWPGGGDSGSATTVKAPAGPIGLQGSSFAGGRSIDNYINHQPDPRLNSIIKKMNSPLRLGLIQQTDEWKDAIDGQVYPFACRFMFNPPVIGVSYKVATSQLPAGQQTVDQLAARAIYPGQTGVSFQLMFDRTYEVAYGPGKNQFAGPDLRKIGVYHDIQALERVVGVSVPTNYTGGGKDHNEDAPAILGNMLMVPVYVLFGGGANNVGLSYVGYFTSLDVQYTLFSQNMVPTRALVTLQFTQIIGSGLADLKGGTVIDRAHAGERSTTASPANKNKPKSSAGGFASDTAA